MAKVLIGRDVTAYTVQGGGVDTAISNFSGGQVTSILGTWKDIRVELEQEWIDVTGSTPLFGLKEKRAGVFDWKSTLSNQVRANGSISMDLMLNNDFIAVSFTEVTTGKTINLVGGMSKSTYERGRAEATDSLDIENVGPVNGQMSIGYV